MTRILRIVIALSLIASSMLALSPSLKPAHAAGPWYVAPGGNDSNSCLSPANSCATINAAIGKATSGDTIYVAIRQGPPPMTSTPCWTVEGGKAG